MFTFVGGDAEAMFAFADQLRQRSEGIREQVAQLGAFLEQVDWKGPDREQFISQWRSVHEPAIQAICDDLLLAADEIEQYARRQQEASSR